MKKRDIVWILIGVVFFCHIILGAVYMNDIFYNKKIYYIIESGIIGLILVNMMLADMIKIVLLNKNE